MQRNRSYFVDPRGRVVRRVTTVLGSSHVITSEVPVSADLEEFKESHPNVRVEGEATTRPQQANPSPKDVVGDLTDEQLEELGLTRLEDAEGDAPGEVEIVEKGNGWFDVTVDGEVVNEKGLRGDDAEALADDYRS